MEQDQQQPSRAEQRMLAVAKLKRAASLPRMKDGRRPPMHVEAVSEGEKGQRGGNKDGDASPPGEAREEPVEMEAEVEAEAEAEADAEAADAEIEDRAISPGPAARKRRSRSRSRSRGSKDLRAKTRALQSPTPTSQLAGDSSPDEAPPPPPLNITGLAPLISPIPSHFLELQRSYLLRSPTPTSPEPLTFNSGTLPQSPILLPTLEAWQRGLFRSNSAGGSNAAGRMMAMHKLTGGTETYDPSSSSPTPSPFPGKLGRNNTVTGGERTAARQHMLSRLGGRITKETDGDQASGGEERSAPSPTPKRRRRRSRRGSASASATTGISDSEFLSTSPNTPLVPPTPLPMTFDALPDLRSRSATPYQMLNLPNQEVEQADFPPPEEPVHGHERLEPARRRSVVVEEDEEEPYPPPRAYPGLPSVPSHRIPSHIAALRTPHASDPPSNGSSDSASPSAVSVPVFMGQRTPPGTDTFPRSPYATPLKEALTRDDDEVLYHADMYRSRTPYEDTFDREISWIASPVPELDIRMPVYDEEDDDQDGDCDQDEEEDEVADEPPLSPRSSNGFSPEEHGAYDDSSPRISSDSKSIVLESETSPIIPPIYIPPSPSAAALSQTASITRASDGSTSPQTYPTRLSVASRSPLNGEFSEWEDRSVNTDTNGKRTGDNPTTWAKVKNTFSRAGSSTGRRSRTNSIVTRERRDHTDSSISRESGASLTSARTDKGDPPGTPSQQQIQQPLMQSPSASASILSLSPHAPTRGGPSPIPPASPADMSKYQNAKLFPFPGMKKLEEQRNRNKGFPSASASSPDIIMLSSSNEEDYPPHSANSYNTTPAQTPDLRERKLSHQASDTRLVTKYNASSSAPPTSYPDYIDIPPQSSTQHGGPLNLKLPMTLPGVKQWLSKNNKKIFSSQASSTSPSASTSIPIAIQSPSVGKSPVLPEIVQRTPSEQLGTDWEEIGSTPTSTSGDTLDGKLAAGLEVSREIPKADGSTLLRSEFTDTEKTPKAKKVMPPSDHSDELDVSSFQDDSPSPSALPSRPDPFSSATPDPSSSLSDYPAHSTSESSSTTSSQYSLGPIGPQGSVVLEQLDEDLARGSRSRFRNISADISQRWLLLSSPVFQVVNNNTLKDRFLFLFNDILVIAKPVISDQDTFMDSHKPTPFDRKLIVKSVVMLNQLRFVADRTESEPSSLNQSMPSRNPLLKSFVHSFSRDPDFAVNSLISRSGKGDDSVAVGQLLFKTLDLDRTRLGEYLTRRTSKPFLKAYLDSFGFLGIRVDQALRVFLLSTNITRTSHHTSSLEYLLDAFAGRWYEANAKVVDYDKDLAHRLVRAIVQLNELLHDGIAQEPGPTGYPRRQVTGRDFVEAFRRYDQRYLVSDELLEDVYESILGERLSQARTSGSSPDVPIVIKRAIPLRLTWKVQSEPIVLRIPQADPDFTIKLYGQDLAFDPPVLNFAKSPEVSFRVMGLSLGSKSMIIGRSGPNAIKYSGLPLSSPVVVERAFMRHTFQVAFQNHNGIKRRYMFSVDDSLIRHQWVSYLRQHVDKAAESLKSASSGTSKYHRAADAMAFRILQETLIGSPPVSANAMHKALQRTNGVSTNSGGTRFSADRAGPSFNSFQLASLHVRSKSRSKVYHRHGAGKNEIDLAHTLNYRGSREDGDDERGEAVATHDHDPNTRSEGPLWSARDLEMYCKYNGTIVAVLSSLQTVPFEQEERGSS